MKQNAHMKQNPYLLMCVLNLMCFIFLIGEKKPKWVVCNSKVFLEMFKSAFLSHFRQLNSRISIGFLGKTPLMVFHPDEGFGEHNPIYIFRVERIITYETKTNPNGIKFKIPKSYYEFYGTQVNPEVTEFWVLENTSLINIGEFIIGCPSVWAERIYGDLKPDEIKEFLLNLDS